MSNLAVDAVVNTIASQFLYTTNNKLTPDQAASISVTVSKIYDSHGVKCKPMIYTETINHQTVCSINFANVIDCSPDVILDLCRFIVIKYIALEHRYHYIKDINELLQHHHIPYTIEYVRSTEDITWIGT
jgi:hypothetical protein